MLKWQLLKPPHKGRIEMMKSGMYWIGDLCYVMHAEWDEVCALIIDDQNPGGGCAEGEFTLMDGRRFAIFNTAYGDGEYPDNGNRTYPVDSGSLGCILLEDIDTKNPENAGWNRWGNIVRMDADFECESDDAGVISFGHVLINTGEESDDDCYENEVEAEDAE